MNDMSTTKTMNAARGPAEVDDSVNGSVDCRTCNYTLYGTSRVRDFIFSVR